MTTAELITYCVEQYSKKQGWAIYPKETDVKLVLKGIEIAEEVLKKMKLEVKK